MALFAFARVFFFAFCFFGSPAPPRPTHTHTLSPPVLPPFPLAKKTHKHTQTLFFWFWERERERERRARRSSGAPNNPDKKTQTPFSPRNTHHARKAPGPWPRPGEEKHTHSSKKGTRRSFFSLERPPARDTPRPSSRRGAARAARRRSKKGAFSLLFFLFSSLAPTSKPSCSSYLPRRFVFFISRRNPPFLLLEEDFVFVFSVKARGGAGEEDEAAGAARLRVRPSPLSPSRRPADRARAEFPFLLFSSFRQPITHTH